MTSGNNRQAVRVMEAFRIVFYTPIYIAVAGGFWETEGLDVTFSTCAPPYPHAFAALNEGAVDIAQSGIMRSIIASDWGAESVPAHIAKINARDGFFVLSREAQQTLSQEGFDWESLRGSTVIPVGFTAMPWASFQFALRNHNIDPAELRLIPGLGLLEARDAFLDGEGDFIHLPQPVAEELMANGQAHLAVALGPENGHIAYSSFAATNGFLNAKPEVAHSFVLGFAKGLEWIASNDAAAITGQVAEFFPRVNPELVLKSVERYKEHGTWPSDPRLEEPEYQGLQHILIGAGLAQQPQPYSKVVRPEFARAAVA